ncbi:hypothetical protein LEN26_008392 [Aphanomyces euteiches]|nr:hypothetical protein LEN26_008392 [Aphanomyces euteiches]
MVKRGKGRQSARAQSHKWLGGSIGSLNGDEYYGGVAMKLANSTVQVQQYSVVRLRQSKDLAMIHVFWEGQDRTMKMEVRYLKHWTSLPSVLQKKIKRSIQAGDELDEMVETTEIDELPVDRVESLVDPASEYICTKLYAHLTRTVTSISPKDDLKRRCFVHSRRLKAVLTKKRTSDIYDSEDNGDSRLNPVERCKQRLEAACDQLQLSSIPDELLGREEERHQIFQTLRSAIVDGDSSPVYISGLPGMGKTATVKEILRSLEYERDMLTIPAFTWIEVNGLHMPRPDQAYSMIWKALQTFHFSARPCKGNLSDKHFLHALFSSQDDDRPVLVLVLDEMDFMLSGKNTVLYNFLEWQSLASSKLVIVGIANIMDLPERLAPKLRSRFGLHRIAFRSYTHEQIQAIIHQRLIRLQVFEPGAIEIYAKALAHQSGDIRKALMVCKAATERALRRLTDTNQTTQVLSSDIEAVQNSMSQSPLLLRLRQCSTFECIFLVALGREIKLNGGSGGTLEGVAHRMSNLCKTAGLTRVPSFAEVQALYCELERSDVLREKKGRLVLTFSHDEIHEAFVSHPVGRLLWT